MNRPSNRTWVLIASLSLVALAQAAPDPSAISAHQRVSATSHVAMMVVDLPSGRTLSVVQPDMIGTRLAPGSVLKVATLVAALESGVISPATRFTCRRRVKVEGRELTCVHPDLGRPMSPAEALAYSCNDFFATIAERLPLPALSAATTALGLGPVAAGTPVPLAAVGLEGIRATPEQLLRAFVRAADPLGLRIQPAAREVLLEGLRGAARYGTARAIGDRGVDALAKTGTAPMPGGGYFGLVLALSPSSRASRGIAVLVPGGSGADAASVAAEALAQLIAGTYGTAEDPTVRASERPNVRKPERPKVDEGRAPPAPSRSARPPVATGPPPTSPGGVPAIRVGRLQPTGGYDVTQVPLEEYVARVVAGEAAPRSAPAALEALAVAVRTFATANRGRHKNDGFDLCDLTHCQVMAAATAATRQAAAATSGQILTWRGAAASIFYTACCGGQSELPSDVWPRAQDQPFLSRHRDESCRRTPEWDSEIAAAELLRAFRTAGFRGDAIRDLRVVRRSGSGRAAVVALDGLDPETITGDQLRLAVGRTLGWQLVKSTAFEVTRTALGYRFTGRGSGHGVGLCVVGSAQMAAEGANAAKILAEYFPGTRIERLAAPQPGTMDDVRIDLALPALSQGSAEDVQRLVRRALADIASRAGVPLPAALQLVFHPTFESYTRQTKRPWWTAAATVGERIDLVPLAVLQERQILEPTLRHELAHLVTAAALAGRPVWVREGAAIYLSGERVGPPTVVAGRTNTLCPSDHELLRSESPAALRDAYARAAACYSRQIAAGRTWDEVR